MYILPKNIKILPKNIKIIWKYYLFFFMKIYMYTLTSHNISFTNIVNTNLYILGISFIYILLIQVQLTFNY